MEMILLTMSADPSEGTVAEVALGQNPKTPMQAQDSLAGFWREILESPWKGTG